MFSHRQSIAEQLRAEEDAAMTLHLAVVLMFQVFTQCMVHAPGRCVPNIISFLMEYVPEEQYKMLIECQGKTLFRLKATLSVIVSFTSP